MFRKSLVFAGVSGAIIGLLYTPPGMLLFALTLAFFSAFIETPILAIFATALVLYGISITAFYAIVFFTKNKNTVHE